MKKKTLPKLLKDKFQQLSNGKRCVFCRLSAQASHHIIYKSHSKYLKYDYRNALPVCLYHHRMIHDDKIEEASGKIKDYTPSWAYLQAHKNISLKQYLVEHGQTEDDFMQEKLSELDYILTGDY